MSPDTVLRRRLAQHAAQGRWSLFVGLGAVLGVAGAALFALAVTGGHAERAWQVFHVNWLYFTGLTAGSLGLVAVYKIANAKWSGLLVRFASATVAFLPVVLVGLVLVFTLGYEHVYGHMQEELHSLPHGKAVWLSKPWMFARLGIGLAALALVGWAMVRRDLAPDAWEAARQADGARRGALEGLARGFDGSAAALADTERRVATLAPVFAVLYALVLTLVAFDGIMALQPHWFSNLLGGWYFMGSFLGANALLALLALRGGHETGTTHLISPKQRHDLGKMIFGFSVFWTYLMWAQFLVIWYGNLPEETGFVFARIWGPWRPMAALVLLGMFIIPFVGLIGVTPKKWPVTLGLFSAVILVALWLERFLMVMPSITAEAGPVFGLPELGPTLLFLGLFLLAYGLAARRFPMVSPRLAEGTLQGESHHVEEATEFLHEEGERDYVSEAAIEEEKGH
ncbi:MAG TPA: hypothetical protein VLA95_12010 [Gemmatimonadales bacterium]|nr:hypothetical protein [Gemmatimonadales bacterium]